MSIILTFSIVINLLPALTLPAWAADHSVTLDETATAGAYFHITSQNIFGTDLAASELAMIGFTRPILTGSDPAVYGDIAYQEGTPYIGADGTNYGEINGIYVSSAPDFYFIADTEGTYTFTAYYCDEVADIDDHYNVTLSVETSSDTAPTASSVSASGTARVGNTLTGSYTYSGGEDESGTAYQWYSAADDSGTDETEISGAASTIYELTADDLGRYICFEVTPSDGTDSGTAVKSGYVGPVAAASAAWEEMADTDWFTDHSAELSFSISTEEELAGFASVVNGGTDFSGKTVTLAADLDLGVLQWTPIGDAGNPFAGSFDGDGYTISNLAIGTPESPNATFAYAGLFGIVDCGTITDIGVENVSIFSSAGYTGGLVGYWNGTDGAATPVTNCYATGSVSTGSDYAGGLIGRADYCIVSNCFAAVAVTGNTTADGFTAAGGLLGQAGASGSVTGCYATGDVASGSSGCAGGLIGILNGAAAADCYAVGDVSCGNYEGGLIGYRETGTVTACYYNSSTGVAKGTGYGADHAAAKTSEYMTSADFVVDLNMGYAGTWASDTDTVNQGYPMLTAFADDSGADTTEPAVDDQTIASSGVTMTGVTLGWNKATDDTSEQTALQYLVYRSDSDNLDTVTDIEANGTAVGSYAADIATADITGLTAGSTYYFNVIVKDEAGNKACYTAISVTIPAVGIELGEAAFTGGKYYYTDTEVTGDGIRTILIAFSNNVTSGDKINLPAAPDGFTVSATSNDYTKRINLDEGVLTSAVQSYLRGVGVEIADETRTVSFTVTTENITTDTFYNIGTEHYYQYIPDTISSWTAAYNTAKNMTYMGRTGYLATVTSLEEDTYLNSLSGGKTGWLGGTILQHQELAADGQHYTGFNTSSIVNTGWYWACGPEIGTIFFSAYTLYPNANSSNAATVDAANTAYYYNWARGNISYEPNNNNGDEHCLTTLTVTDGGNINYGKHATTFSWNDKAYNTAGTGTWDAKGYFVEYGNRLTGDDGDGGAAFASDSGELALLSGDATLKTSSTIKGAAASLGTPSSALGSETAGSVTLTPEQAADTGNMGNFITLFDPNDANACIKAVKYAKGASAANFAGDAAYANEAIHNGDFFIVKVTAQDGATVNYYRIIVTIPATVALADAVWTSVSSYTCGITMSSSSEMVTISVDGGYFTVPSLGSGALVFLGGTYGTTYYDAYVSASQAFNSAVFSFEDASAAEALLGSIVYSLGGVTQQQITATVSTAAPQTGDIYFEGHFYRYVVGSIDWVSAALAAGGTTDPYFGGRGYLATATSQAENSILLKLVDTGATGDDHWNDAWMGGLWQRNTGTVESPSIMRGTDSNEISYEDLCGTTLAEQKNLLLRYTVRYSGDPFCDGNTSYIYDHPERVLYYWFDGPEAGQEIANNVTDGFSPWHSGEPNSGDFVYIGWQGAYWDDLGAYNGSNFATLSGYIVEFSGFGEDGSTEGIIADDTQTVGTDTTVPDVTDKTITASDITRTGATLGWNKATDDRSAQTVLRYLVYRSSGDNLGTVAEIETNGTALGSYAADIAAKDVTGLTADTTYYFNVIVQDESGNKTCYTVKSVTTLPPITAAITPAEALDEDNLDTNGLTVELSQVTFGDAVLDAANFTLNNASDGVSIESVSYTDATRCTVNLAYDETDFDSDVNDFSLTINAAELSEGGDLTTGALTITATVETVPTVTAVSPASGKAAGGTSVRITGTDFAKVIAVRFGDNDAVSFTVDSATRITAVSPAADSGTVYVTVTTKGGTSTTNSNNAFTYILRDEPDPDDGTAYESGTYFVVFRDWDGTALEIQSVGYGEEAQVPEAPTRAGYTFTGWDISYNESTGSMTMVAKYSENPSAIAAYPHTVEPDFSGAGGAKDGETPRQTPAPETTFEFAQGDTWECVTGSFAVRGSSGADAQITWSSSDEDVVLIESSGSGMTCIVTRPKGHDARIVLTAKVTQGDITIAKTFLLVVKQEGISKEETRLETGRAASVRTGKTAESEAIYRTVMSDGTKIDYAVLTAETVQKAVEQGGVSDTITVTIGEDAGAPANEFAFEVPLGTLSGLVQNRTGVTLESPAGTVTLSADTLSLALQSGTSLYLRIVPAAGEATEAKEAFLGDAAIFSIANQTGQVFGIPKTIQTNMENFEVTVTLPLEGLSGEQLADEAFLATLGVYVEHDDGTTELLDGTLVYTDGVATGVRFPIDRFSRFQVVSVTEAKPAAATGNLWGWILWSAGGLLALAGVILLAVRRKKKNEAEAR
jgi:hypothetical protein